MIMTMLIYLRKDVSGTFSPMWNALEKIPVKSWVMPREGVTCRNTCECTSHVTCRVTFCVSCHVLCHGLHLNPDFASYL
jgi:hypothetical protein